MTPANLAFQLWFKLWLLFKNLSSLMTQLLDVTEMMVMMTMMMMGMTG